jgi:hypothetical protein
MSTEQINCEKNHSAAETKRQAIKESMKEWFLRRYEDPSENTPYDSSEGGFLYIWGGPCEPNEVLFDEFDGKVDDDLIDEVAEELASIRDEWARIPTIEDYDGMDIPLEVFDRFVENLSLIKQELANLKHVADNNFVCSLLFAYTITSLEAYLSDAFLNCMKIPKYLLKFVETDTKLRKERTTATNILETLQISANTCIQKIVFHRLDRVQAMYQNSLGIDLPPGILEIESEIQKRHDIIHRGCRDKKGNEFLISQTEVESLLSSVERFVKALDAKMPKVTMVDQAVKGSEI